MPAHTTDSGDVMSPESAPTPVDLYDDNGDKVVHLHTAARMRGINTRRHIGWQLMGMLPPPAGLFNGRPVWREIDLTEAQQALPC